MAFRSALLVLCMAVLAMATDFYEVLGVAKDADEGVIKKAYRRLSLKYHPGSCHDATWAANKVCRKWLAC